MSISQFVTFKVDDYHLGLDILSVREINRNLEMTPVPKAPDYVRGLANLRGQIITVFDLGVRLGLGSREIDEKTHIVVLKKDGIGLMVDEIDDVVAAEERDIESPPGHLGGLNRSFVESVVQLEKSLLIALSPIRLAEYRFQSSGDYLEP